MIDIDPVFSKTPNEEAAVTKQSVKLALEILQSYNKLSEFWDEHSEIVNELRRIEAFENFHISVFLLAASCENLMRNIEALVKDVERVVKEQKEQKNVH